MSTATSLERPGMPLAVREREALATVMGWVGVALGGVDGATNGRAIVRYYSGWLDEHKWQGLWVPDADENGRRRLVHAWSGETLRSSHVPGVLYAASSIYDVYKDGDMRVVDVPLQDGDRGPRPDQYKDAFQALTEYADRPTPLNPSDYSDRVRRVAENLPHDVLRGAAVWMLDGAAAESAQIADVIAA